MAEKSPSSLDSTSNLALHIDDSEQLFRLVIFWLFLGALALLLYGRCWLRRTRFGGWGMNPAFLVKAINPYNAVPLLHRSSSLARPAFLKMFVHWVAFKGIQSP